MSQSQTLRQDDSSNLQPGYTEDADEWLASISSASGGQRPGRLSSKPAPVVPIAGPLLQGAYKTAARVFRARTVHCSHPYNALGGPNVKGVLPKVQYYSVRTFPMIQQGPSDIPSFIRGSCMARIFQRRGEGHRCDVTRCRLNNRATKSGEGDRARRRCALRRAQSSPRATSRRGRG